jgi:hypothetical protein
VAVSACFKVVIVYQLTYSVVLESWLPCKSWRVVFRLLEGNQISAVQSRSAPLGHPRWLASCRIPSRPSRVYIALVLDSVLKWNLFQPPQRQGSRRWLVEVPRFGIESVCRSTV